MASHLLAFVVCMTTMLPLAGCVDEVAIVGEDSQAIINGAQCGPEEMPETVALLIDATINFDGTEFPIRRLLCTGTLIAPDVVLTAAHCLDETATTGGVGSQTATTYYVSRSTDLRSFLEMGQELPELPVDAMAARSVVKHESFTLDVEEAPTGLSNFYDIGLVFLEERVTNLEPAIVMTPEEAKGLGVGLEVQIAGWGQQAVDPNGPSGTKHCATSEIFEISEFEMQIGNEPSTARKCHGDSGGPTMITISTESKRKQRVIGATSRAYDMSDCQKGGVDTLASAWYDWIDEKMSERCAVNQRAWCDVPGVIPPSYYDSATTDPSGSESGGCQSGGRTGGSSALLLLLGLACFQRRRRIHR